MGKTNQPNFQDSLSARLTAVRVSHYGERGRSEFARDLGVPITTYVHYETGRSPPAELLLKVARLTGTRLEWLIAGSGVREDLNQGQEADPVRALADEFARLLFRSPELIPSAEEFVKALRGLASDHSQLPLSPPGSDAQLIPIIGSTAAGLAHYWSELKTDVGGAEADARVEEILQKLTSEVTSGDGETTVVNSLEGDSVSLVQYSTPDQYGILEFLSAAGLKKRYPKAVAWRIDGDSMTPRYADGDLVVTSPDFPAVESHPCVARQINQIGVNCKLYQSQGDEILLIPINPACETQRFPRSSLLWAWRVLASVRLK